MKKKTVKKATIQKHGWKLVDASGQSLGRLSSGVSKLLMGKNKADFSPHQLDGDFVIVTNSDKIRLTGKKWTQKIYYTHSGYFGSLKEKKAKDTSSQEIIKKAIQGMLPKNKLRAKLLKRLRIFKTEHHNYQDKKPEEIRF